MGYLPLGQISIKIQNRTYRLNCGDGEEARLKQLAAFVGEKAQALVDEHGRISDEHLMLMSAILIADELWDERTANQPSAQDHPAARKNNQSQKVPLDGNSDREAEVVK